MILNKEWYIISRELETLKIKNQNYIKHGSHLKVNPTLKAIKKSGFDWSKIEEDIREFYFKCSTCEIRTSKQRIKLCSQAYRIWLSHVRISCWYSTFVWILFNDIRYFFTMVDHFTKFGWAILMKNKKAKISWVFSNNDWHLI